MVNDKINVVGTNIAEKATMIWNVADMLRGPFKPHEYGLVILPMTVVKRFHDCLPVSYTHLQLYRICHISKSTALYLLQSGKIPCEYTGRKTRCYKIKKEDVIAYLENRKVFPESYSAPAGWYKGDYTVQMEEQVPPIVREHLRLYYTCLLYTSTVPIVRRKWRMPSKGSTVSKMRTSVF